MIVNLKAVLETQYEEIMTAVAVLFPIFHENEEEEMNAETDKPWGNDCGEFYTEVDYLTADSNPPYEVSYSMKIKYVLYKSWYLHTVMIMNPMRCAQELCSEAMWMSGFVLEILPNKIKFLENMHNETQRLVGLLEGRVPNKAFRQWLIGVGQLEADVMYVINNYMVTTHNCEDCSDSPVPDMECVLLIGKLLSVMHEGHIVMDLTK